MVLQITSLEAWKILQEGSNLQRSNSVLVDVRTKEEVEFVGFVDLSKINAQIIFLPWRTYPGNEINGAFTDELTEILAKTFPDIRPDEINLIFLCRSGNRSFEAAMFMSDFGYNCYNLTNGFEGKIDDLGHRSKINGWKAENLPWRQN